MGFRIFEVTPNRHWVLNLARKAINRTARSACAGGSLRHWLWALALCCLLLGQPSPEGVAAPPPPFSHDNEDYFRLSAWTTEQGLPQNTVTALHQTRDDYLWIGTRYGLARFDGVRMVSFADELGQVCPEALGIRGLVEDRAGTLWIHSWTNLLSWDHGSFKVAPLANAPFPGRPGSEALTQMLGVETKDIEALLEDPEHRLWAARPGELLMWDGTSHRSSIAWKENEPSRRNGEGSRRTCTTIWVRVSRGWPCNSRLPGDGPTPHPASAPNS